MAQSTVPIHIIAQPRASYRERYLREMGRAQRYIRADINSEGLDYPTIEIPKEWQRPRIYIRVTLVTVVTEQAPDICIHPYPIDTPELNIIRDAERNSIYFPVTDEDINTNRKSFRISCKKLIQYELRNYGQLRLLELDVQDIPRTDDSNDARKLICAYQLGQSQLLFSVAELLQDNELPAIYKATFAYSVTMAAITAAVNDDDSPVRCAPQKGDWQGDDEILMFIPKLDRRKTYKVYFEHSSMYQIDPIPIEFVDTKTIAIRTPPCPLQTIGNQTMEIPIVVTQNDEEVARVKFLYQSYANKCFGCTSNNLDLSQNYEQSYAMEMYCDEGGDFSLNNDLFFHVNC